MLFREIKNKPKNMSVSKNKTLLLELLNVKLYFKVLQKFKPPLKYLELSGTVPETSEFD